MNEKRDPSRFTIKLSAQAPDAQLVAGILNRLGHSKGQFIVSAVLCYLDTPQGAAYAGQPTLSPKPPTIPLRQRQKKSIPNARPSSAFPRPTAATTPTPSTNFSGQAEQALKSALDALNGSF